MRRRWAKFFVGVLLLPFCFGATQALIRVVQRSGGALGFWIAVGSGVVTWLVLYYGLPKPMRLYVLGHELTHAIWTWMFGGRVEGFRATARGGYVQVSKSNFLIVLSPYFFPLYSVLWVGLWVGIRWIWDIRSWAPLFHFGIGVTYAFHATLTIYVLRFRQPDIVGEGWVFSGAVIWLGNVLVTILGVAWLAGGVGALTVLGWWLEETGRIVSRLGRLW